MHHGVTIVTTPTKNKDNLSSRIDIIKIDPRITDNRTPEKARRIFGSYQRHKKRNNKEHNLPRIPIKIKQNANKENKTIQITQIPEKNIRAEARETETQNITVG